jgi:cell pole-organizing protein PopZ
MDLGNKGGQPSMEEILASIRRIIAEEPTTANPVIDLHARQRRHDDADDNNDFELPSIFRPAAPSPERQPLFGRLTDAIRNASGAASSETKQPKPDSESDIQDRYRGALRDSGILAVANGVGSMEATSPGAPDNDRYRGALRDAPGSSLSSALSSLKLTRGADATPLAERTEAIAAPVSVADIFAPDPAMSASPPPPARPVPKETGPKAGAVEDVRRVMVPFRDMRMSRMGGAAGSASADNETPVETLLQAHPAAHPAPAPAYVTPADAFQASLQPVPAAPPSFDAGLSLDDMHRFAAVVEQPRMPAPPPVAPPAAAAGGGIEDATADLLRPMLRQWLAENMPRMVEKALSIELAQSVKQTRKFNGY